MNAPLTRPVVHTRKAFAESGGRIKGQIGINSRPEGGFGNRTLTYLSIRHIAHAVGADYFFVNPMDQQVVEGVHRPLRGLRGAGLRKILRRADTEKPGFLGDLSGLVSRGRNVVFKGPLLADVLVRFATVNSREFASLQVKQCEFHQEALGMKKLVAVHLRAGDFRDWNPEAILPADFYISALDSLSEASGDEWQVRICVDDSSHPALWTLENHLYARGLLPRPLKCPSPFKCDLAAMSGAEFLVSSPSTFALVAGILGSPRVIHSARWVRNRINRGERFWREIGEGSFPGYTLERLV